MNCKLILLMYKAICSLLHYKSPDVPVVLTPLPAIVLYCVKTCVFKIKLGWSSLIVSLSIGFILSWKLINGLG
jgi:hypothetical protein